MGSLTADLLAQLDEPPTALTFNEALHRERRARLRVVRDVDEA